MVIKFEERPFHSLAQYTNSLDFLPPGDRSTCVERAENCFSKRAFNDQKEIPKGYSQRLIIDATSIWNAMGKFSATQLQGRFGQFLANLYKTSGCFFRWHAPKFGVYQIHVPLWYPNEKASESTSFFWKVFRWFLSWFITDQNPYFWGFIPQEMVDNNPTLKAKLNEETGILHLEKVKPSVLFALQRAQTRTEDEKKGALRPKGLPVESMLDLYEFALEWELETLAIEIEGWIKGQLYEDEIPELQALIEERATLKLFDRDFLDTAARKFGQIKKELLETSMEMILNPDSEEKLDEINRKYSEASVKEQVLKILNRLNDDSEDFTILKKLWEEFANVSSSLQRPEENKKGAQDTDSKIQTSFFDPEHPFKSMTQLTDRCCTLSREDQRQIVTAVERYFTKMACDKDAPKLVVPKSLRKRLAHVDMRFFLAMRDHLESKYVEGQDRLEERRRFVACVQKATGIVFTDLNRFDTVTIAELPYGTSDLPQRTATMFLDRKDRDQGGMGRDGYTYAEPTPLSPLEGDLSTLDLTLFDHLPPKLTGKPIGLMPLLNAGQENTIDRWEKTTVREAIQKPSKEADQAQWKEFFTALAKQYTLDQLETIFNDCEFLLIVNVEELTPDQVYKVLVFNIRHRKNVRNMVAETLGNSASVIEALEKWIVEEINHPKRDRLMDDLITMIVKSKGPKEAIQTLNKIDPENHVKQEIRKTIDILFLNEILDNLKKLKTLDNKIIENTSHFMSCIHKNQSAGDFEIWRKAQGWFGESYKKGHSDYGKLCSLYSWFQNPTVVARFKEAELSKFRLNVLGGLEWVEMAVKTRFPSSELFAKTPPDKIHKLLIKFTDLIIKSGGKGYEHYDFARKNPLTVPEAATAYALLTSSEMEPWLEEVKYKFDKQKGFLKLFDDTYGGETAGPITPIYNKLVEVFETDSKVLNFILAELRWCSLFGENIDAEVKKGNNEYPNRFAKNKEDKEISSTDIKKLHEIFANNEGAFQDHKELKAAYSTLLKCLPSTTS